MNAHVSVVEGAVTNATRDYVAELLSRYPSVSAGEAQTILTFLRTGRHLDVGILTGDEKLKPALDRFMADHAKHFRVSFGEATAVIAAIAAFLIVCWLIWEAVKPGG